MIRKGHLPSVARERAPRGQLMRNRHQEISSAKCFVQRVVGPEWSGAPHETREHIS